MLEIVRSVPIGGDAIQPHDPSGVTIIGKTNTVATLAATGGGVPRSQALPVGWPIVGQAP